MRYNAHFCLQVSHRHRRRWLTETQLPHSALTNAFFLQTALIQDLEILTVSVACVTSLSDPIIYAAVNPQFRTEFDRLRRKVESVFGVK